MLEVKLPGLQIFPHQYFDSILFLGVHGGLDLETFNFHNLEVLYHLLNVHGRFDLDVLRDLLETNLQILDVQGVLSSPKIPRLTPLTKSLISNSYQQFFLKPNAPPPLF